MRYRRALCIALAALLAALCAGCGGGQLLSDLDTLAQMDLGSVLEQAMGGESAQPETETAVEVDARAVFPEEPDVIRGGDGCVLAVREDGTCTYKVPAEPYGGDPKGEIVFEGTVEDGDFTFTRVSYFGIDITALAQQEGLDAAHWEAEAAALYGR